MSSGEPRLSQEDVSNLVSQLKNQEMPSKIQASKCNTIYFYFSHIFSFLCEIDCVFEILADTPSSSSGAGAGVVKEVRRTRLDPTTMLLENMSLHMAHLPQDKSMSVSIF